MKLLVFQIGADRYALRLREIERVLPLAALKQLPGAPACVAGLLDLHGTPVPVIDLSRLAGLATGAWSHDSRIILVAYPLASGQTRELGLLAEHVLGVQELDPATLCQPGVAAAPFLGPVASAPAGMLQLVQVQQLLGAELCALLFPTELAP